MTDDSPADARQIDLYWRPGCGFCMGLDRQLRRHGIEVTRHNIWEDPAAADHVRSIANGNETVPTVSFGTTSLVNPSIDRLVDTLVADAPHLLPDDYEPPESGAVTRLLSRLTGSS